MTQAWYCGCREDSDQNIPLFDRMLCLHLQIWPASCKELYLMAVRRQILSESQVRFGRTSRLEVNRWQNEQDSHAVFHSLAAEKIGKVLYAPVAFSVLAL